MPDTLTSEERAAIAAFPEDQIRRCARGESGIPIQSIPIRISMRQAVQRARWQGKFRRSKEIDENILALWKQGLTDNEISEKVKLKPGAIYQRRYRMSLGIKDKL